jgi:O-antigen/teichoic acid export membrane protein
VSTGWVVLLTWPLYLSVYGFAPWLLGLLGDEFASSLVPLRMLAAAMLFAGLAGPVDAVLLMVGRSTLSMLNTTAGLATNLALNALLIPAHGITGAAAAWAVAIVVTRLLPLVELHALLRIHPLGPEVRAAAGTAATFGVACLVVEAFAGSAPTIVCAAAATFGVLVWRRRRRLQLTGLLPVAQGSATHGR